MSRRYTQEQKEGALKWLSIRRGNVKVVSDQLGIPERTLQRWKSQHEAPPPQEIPAPQPPQPPQEGTVPPPPPTLRDHDGLLRDLRERLAHNANALSGSLEEAIQEAPLNQRAQALNYVMDRLMELDTVLPPNPANGNGNGHVELHANQLEILNHPGRFRVVAAGRRFGKTEVGKRLILQHARAGGRCWWLSPTYPMAGDVWRDLKRAARRIKGRAVNEQERRIDLPGGGFLEIHSAHLPDNLRGAGLDFAVLDETAFMHPAIWPEIVRPMLVESQGEAIFLSTPSGRNHFWELYQLGADTLQDEWISFHFTSYDNPLLPHEELETIRRNTPERIFRQEYLAEFSDNAGQVFRAIREAATAPLNSEPIPDHRYVAGIDWGREDDYTAIVILDATARQMVALDRFNQIGWALQRGRLSALCAIWQPVAIWAEENSIGSPNIEQLQAEGLPVRPFKTTVQTKARLVETLALGIERSELTLLPDDTLLAELAAFRLQRLPAGNYRYSAPPGGHDDTVIALALAWYGQRYHTAYTIHFA